MTTVNEVLPIWSPWNRTKYKYDALGRRIEKIVDGNITRYVYDNEDILLEFDGNNTLQARYTHGLGIDEPLFMERNGEVFTYHTDGLGSVVALTDSSGQTVQSYVYESFGKTKIFDAVGVEITADQGIKNPYTYTARELDPESGLYYYRARFYDSGTGRFISEEPLALSPEVNRYTYSLNNPINFIDSSGRFPIPVLPLSILLPIALPGIIIALPLICIQMPSCVAAVVRLLLVSQQISPDTPIEPITPQLEPSCDPERQSCGPPPPQPPPIC